jgi:hypothetical protein
MIAMCFAFAKAYSQQVTANANETVKLTSSDASQLVTEFFVAFHQQDTTAMREMMVASPQMQSQLKKDGNIQYAETTIDTFLSSIASIPDNVQFEERLTSMEVLSGNGVATVHTDYEFIVNQNLSHTGRNIFTLFQTADGWRIAQIADTRVY